MAQEDLRECFQVLQEGTASMSLEEAGQEIITHEEGEQWQPQGGIQNLPEPIFRNILERLEWTEWLKNRLVCVWWNTILNQPHLSISCNAASSCQKNGPRLLLTDTAGLLMFARWREEEQRYVYLLYDPVYRTTREVPPLLPWHRLPGSSSSSSEAASTIFPSRGAGSYEVRPSTKLIALQIYVQHYVEYLRISKYVSGGNSWEVISEFRREDLSGRSTPKSRVWFTFSGIPDSLRRYVSNVCVIGDRTFLLLIPNYDPMAYFYDYESEPSEEHNLFVENKLCEVVSDELKKLNLPIFMRRNCHIQIFEHGSFLYVARSCRWPQEKVQLWKVELSGAVNPSGDISIKLVSSMPVEFARDLLFKCYGVEESSMLSFHIEAEGDYACFTEYYNPSSVIVFDLKKIEWKKFDLNFDHRGQFYGRRFMSFLWKPRLDL
ncbi:hypothetical protein AXG93_3791s1130 [Marchantia polymorpha subsp. ruderalis]|uniref:F-box domain-containing protein n=1 Tax=Marchantia polymorpha subsp. ruderalis TaxID=1480154 RepID=A0A176WQ82_MARPO|nr:hypothetical protein AXG93_3791s1130 [Marchantia polymorpha subsp. ruderalis]